VKRLTLLVPFLTIACAGSLPLSIPLSQKLEARAVAILFTGGIGIEVCNRGSADVTIPNSYHLPLQVHPAPGQGVASLVVLLNSKRITEVEHVHDFDPMAIFDVTLAPGKCQKVAVFTRDALDLSEMRVGDEITVGGTLERPADSRAPLWIVIPPRTFKVDRIEPPWSSHALH